MDILGEIEPGSCGLYSFVLVSILRFFTFNWLDFRFWLFLESCFSAYELDFFRYGFLLYLAPATSWYFVADPLELSALWAAFKLFGIFWQKLFRCVAVNELCGAILNCFVWELGSTKEEARAPCGTLVRALLLFTWLLLHWLKGLPAFYEEAKIGVFFISDAQRCMAEFTFYF